MNKKITEGIYWVGVKETEDGLQCNPYLLIDGNVGVLIDPGSVLTYEQVLNNVKEIIPLRKIKYVILHHQDPDVCSCLPKLEKEIPNIKIVTHWRTKVIVKYYDIKSDYYLVDENNYSLKLKSGRELSFVPAPYLHFPGAIATYDKKTRTLLSGDVFGSIANNLELYADENYMEGMISFHEHYMPSNLILRPVMESLLLMDIDRIAPQHGSIIEENVQDHIKALRDLECGIFINPVKKIIKDAGGYAEICSLILKKYTSVFSNREISQALQGLDITMGDSPHEIADYNCSGMELWEQLFETIYKNKGIKWILMVEPLVERICKEYEMPIPNIISSEIIKTQEESMILKQEMDELKEQSARVNENISAASGRIAQCPITGLYNETFFFEYLRTVVDVQNKINTKNASIILLSIDDVSRIKLIYGQEEYDNTLKTMTYSLKQIRRSSHMLFRLDSGNFAYLGNNISKDDLIKTAEAIRNEVKNSKKFIEEMSVSIGAVHFSDIENIKAKHSRDSEQMYEAALLRLRIAKSRGGDIVVADTDIRDLEYDSGKIMLVDEDVTNTNVLKAYLNNREYNVICAHDGEEAAEIALRELPSLIISEIMLPKMDGFILKEKLSYESATKKIPFILLSNLKNENSVKRAFSLGIEHYIKKPYMITEILGIVDIKLRREQR